MSVIGHKTLSYKVSCPSHPCKIPGLYRDILPTNLFAGPQFSVLKNIFSGISRTHLRSWLVRQFAQKQFLGG
jgi:hypothetical protein